MGRYDGLETAIISEKGTKLSKGTHVVSLDAVSISENGKNGDYFIAEFTVIGSGNEADPVGESRTWTQSLAKKTEYLPKLKMFAYAVLGYNRKLPADAVQLTEVDKTLKGVLAALEDKSDPLKTRGRKLKVTVDDIITGQNRPFKTHDWLPGQTDKL